MKIDDCRQQIRTHKFQTPISADGATVAAAIQQGKSPARLVSLMGGQYWSVRVRISGKQRLVGLFAPCDFESAYRLADLTIHYFHPKSRRFNLTPDQLAADIQNEPAINALLKLLAAAPKESNEPPIANPLQLECDEVERLIDEQQTADSISTEKLPPFLQLTRKARQENRDNRRKSLRRIRRRLTKSVVPEKSLCQTRGHLAFLKKMFS